MFVNWWDNPMNPDAWHKHQVSVRNHRHGRSCQAPPSAPRPRRVGLTPSPPTPQHKHTKQQQLAWFGAAFWVVVFGVAFGGGKKKDAAAPAKA
jgi:hypothetical protein